MTIYIVRHGEILSNVKGVYSGSSEETLTSRGIKQARQTGRILADQNIEIIYSSPMRRAVQTAEIIAGYCRSPIFLESGFSEIRMGPWEGKQEEKVAIEFPREWKIWGTRPAELKIEGRETLRELLDRVQIALMRIKEKNHQGGVVIVTHYAVVRVALLHARGQELNLYKSVIVPNCKPFKMEV